MTDRPNVDPARVQRALKQRIYLLGRDGLQFTVHGSTGSRYKVSIGQLGSRCNCFDAKRGHFCKHQIFCHHRVLRLDLKDIRFVYDDETLERLKEVNVVKQRFGECPVCFEDVEQDGEEPLWHCQVECGNSAHQDCIDMWFKGHNTCPMCRAAAR